jgi:hypothetical protein
MASASAAALGKIGASMLKFKQEQMEETGRRQSPRVAFA